jgi:methyl-accepting chemotaxis protein
MTLFNQLKLVHKLIGICLVAFLALGVVTAVGFRSLRVSDVSGRLVSANAVQRAQMDGDMMHDAIRADVALCSVTKNAGEVNTGIASIAEHIQRMREDMSQVKQSPEPEVQRALGETAAPLRTYLEEAERYVQSTTGKVGVQPASTFGEAFDTLEDKMGKLGDSIDISTRRVADEAAAARSAATQVNLWVSAACGTLLVVLCWMLVSSIRRPLGAMASAARAVAAGDIQQTLTATSADEIGDLARALGQMIDYIREKATAAEALGRGDLEISVTPRSEQDTLGKSFLSMKQSLSRLVKDSSVLIQGARAGDLSRRADVSGLSGAFREMLEGQNALLSSVGAPIAEAKAVLARVEGRDLTARMTGEYAGDYAVIKASLNSAVQTLEHALGEVASVADGVASAAQQITTGSTDLAETVSAQLAIIEKITGELGETTNMSKQNASNAEGSRTHAVDAMTSAEKGSEGMRRLSVAVESMKAAADETAKIVRTIDEIAFQTNLLSLNAAVEAARAGDAGRGFAVVAEEVRTLAMRSAEAARNTTQVIERSLKKAEEGVQLNRDASVAFDAIFEQVKKISQAMATIAESSQKQHAGVARVTSSADTIRDGAQAGAATAEETAAAATELAAQAASMREMTATFRLGDAGTSSPRPGTAPGGRARGGARNGHANGHGSGRSKGHLSFDDFS